MNNGKKLSLLIVFVSLFIGIVLGSAAAGRLSEDEIIEISSALSPAEETASHIYFLKSVYQSATLAFIIWFSGITLAGGILSPAIIIIKGYSVGLTVGAFLKILGIKGLLASLGGVLPHNIIIITACILLAVLSINFSSEILKKGSIKKPLFTYTLYALFLTFVMCTGSLIEGYVSHPLLKIIVGEGL